MTEQIAIWGLLGLAGFVLLWSIYHAGKSSQQASQARQDVVEAVEVEKRNNELEEQSAAARDEAVRAGDGAGAAPDDPSELPDAVRARIFGRRRKGVGPQG